jgi:hypothetical protein
MRPVAGVKCGPLPAPDLGCQILQRFSYAGAALYSATRLAGFLGGGLSTPIEK